MRVRSSFAIGLIALTLSIDAAPRRRAVGKPFADPSTVEGWLVRNAHVLTSDQLVPYSFDLEPLRDMLGSTGVVGIGDGTHGTAQFYTMKLRFIDFLVREMGFDVVAFEAPFPAMNRIDAYVQGGPGNARELVKMMKQQNYFFWDSEELVQVVEWMREYNAHRGDRPPVHIAGFDIYEVRAAADAVLAYLRAVDPAGAASAENSYSCIPAGAMLVVNVCNFEASLVQDYLSSHKAALIAQTSTAAFNDALQNARVIVQSGTPIGVDRDNSMVANALWMRENRGTTRKIILWAHNAHIAKAGNEWAFDQPMGKTLREQLGSNDYFSIGTLTAQGSYRQARTADYQISSFPPLSAASIETKFRERGATNLLIPLRGELPSWLSGVVLYNTAAIAGPPGLPQNLSEQHDAAIFIDTTTPITSIP
jgi:erythromycin esterase